MAGFYKLPGLAVGLFWSGTHLRLNNMIATLNEINTTSSNIEQWMWHQLYDLFHWLHQRRINPKNLLTFIQHSLIATPAYSWSLLINNFTTIVSSIVWIIKSFFIILRQFQVVVLDHYFCILFYLFRRSLIGNLIRNYVISVFVAHHFGF